MEIAKLCNAIDVVVLDLLMFDIFKIYKRLPLYISYFVFIVFTFLLGRRVRRSPFNENTNANPNTIASFSNPNTNAIATCCATAAAPMISSNRLIRMD